MAFADRNDAALSGINMTPLIDVLMVLLVIFMISVPVLEFEFGMDLASSPEQPDVQPERIELRIDAGGGLHWNGHALPLAALPATLRVEAARSPQPVIALAADDHARYQQVAGVLAETQRAGLTRVGFPFD